MGFLDQQPRWQKVNEKTGVDVEERFLDDSIDERNSFDDDLERLNALSSSRRCFNIRALVDGRIALTVLNILVLAATVMAVTGFPWRIIDKNQCVRETSSHSSLFRAQTVQQKTVHFNGTLFPGEDPAWSRREPGDKEAEAIWDHFETMHTFPITRADVVALGKDPATAVKYSEDFGLGNEAYVASLDVQHKIHCLNELRQMAFADYGDNAPTKHEHGQLWWIHLRHCVDMLAQDLICHADADLITYQWVDTQENPFPDFALNRQCRSLDDVMAYRDENRVEMKQYVAMRRPEGGFKEVPMDREFYAMYGFKNSTLFPNGEGFGPMPKSDWFGVSPKDGVPAGDRAHAHS